MPPPNTPEEGVTAPTAPTSRPVSPTLIRSTSPHPSSAVACASRGDSALLDLDYQSIEYIGPVDETLLCPVCKTPFHSPITTPCGHTFCAGCINRALEMQAVCPIDRQPINKTRDYHRLPLIIKDQLDRLRVKCPNKGCSHECSREHLERHVERRCEFTLIQCPDPNCTKQVMRRDALPEIGCMHQEIICQYCDETVTVAELDMHYDTSCDGATAECPECGTTVVRHRLGRHTLNDCVEAETKCRWSTAGCKVNGKRRAVQAHERSGCIYEAIAQMKEQRDEDSRTIALLTGRITALENRNRRRDQRQRDREGEPDRDRPAQSQPSLDRAFFNSIRLPGPRTGVTNGATNPNPGPIGSSGIAAPLFPPVPSPPPPTTTQNHHLSSDPNNDTAAASSSSTWASPEDYMLARFERIESHLEELGKQLADIDAHQSMSLMQHATRVNDQMADLTSKVGVLNMHTTWLMNMQRSQSLIANANATAAAAGREGREGGQQQQQGQGQGQRNGGSGSGNGGGGGGGENGGTGGGVGRMGGQRRRNSDGRPTNPPRL